MSLFTVPFPLGVNNLFANGRRGRFPTKRYKAWRAEAAAELLRQRPKPVPGLFTFTMKLHKPDGRIRDLDGLTKCVLDSLKLAGLIEDDSLAMEINLKWVDTEPRKDAPVYVGLYPYGQGVRA